MATTKAKRKMKYRVKPEHVGKVKLDSEKSSITLDEQTPQGVLEQFYDTPVGKGFIEQVAEKPAETK